MPELPEVEVIMQGIAPFLAGRRIENIASSGKKLRLSVPMGSLKKWISGSRVEHVGRRAKYGLIHMDNGSVLVLHFGMTGKLYVLKPKVILARGKHDHFFMSLDNGTQVRFNDVRRFGSVQVFGPRDPARQMFFAAMGPEPFAEEFSTGYLQKQAGRRKQPIKNFLMDSRTVSGIGNIYASEILFRSRVHPLTPVSTLSQKKWCRVVASTKQVLKEAIESGGSSISDFVSSSGEKGYFQVKFRVYGRLGQSCLQCGHPVHKTVLAGRATFFCPKCQRE